jgi:ApaG protein
MRAARSAISDSPFPPVRGAGTEVYSHPRHVAYGLLTAGMVGTRSQNAMYTASTRSITVTVSPSYLEDESAPAQNEFRWSYHVRIENHGQGTVKLISRYWRITDAVGRVKEVRGPGVVGEQPTLQPGHAFEYQSWTPLDTPSGIMVGAYQMQEKPSGELFDVAIPAFSLDSPYQPIRLN